MPQYGAIGVFGLMEGLYTTAIDQEDKRLLMENKNLLIGPSY
jgi:hypothetical protein